MRQISYYFLSEYGESRTKSNTAQKFLREAPIFCLTSFHGLTATLVSRAIFERSCEALGSLQRTEIGGGGVRAADQRATPTPGASPLHFLTTHFAAFSSDFISLSDTFVVSGRNVTSYLTTEQVANSSLTTLLPCRHPRARSTDHQLTARSTDHQAYDGWSA